MLKRVTLHLARNPDHPNGAADIGYDLVAPLDADGHLDAELCRTSQRLCRVRRFAPGEPDRVGLLVHRAGGTGGATWVFDFEPNEDADDEPGFRLESHVFKAGEYVSIGDARRHYRTFQVVDVHPVAGRG